VPEDEGNAAELLGADHTVTDAAVEHVTAAEAEALGARLSSLLVEPPTVYDTDANETRAARPEDIAILLRRRTHLGRYQRALDAHNIPYSVISGAGFYDTPEVQTLVNLLRVLADPSDEISLYGVLRSPLFGFTDDRLAPLAATEASLWQGLNTTDDKHLRDAAELLNRWRELAGCVHSDETEVLPWNRVLTRVLDDTGYLVSIGADEGGKQAVANVEKFRDEIREWSEGGTRTAASVLRRIDRQTELDPREGEAEVPEGTEGVRIMTIHAAKGLEFPIVVVPDLGSDLNFGRSVDEYGYVRLITDHDDDPFLAVGGPSPADAFDVEKTTAHRYADDIELPRERAEAKRLLYVACTRSRDYLLLCGTHEFEETEDGLALAEVNDLDEAQAWRDWLQPTLLEHEGILQNLVETGRSQGRLGEARYAVQLPNEGVRWQEGDSSTEESETKLPHIEIPKPPDVDQRRRISATQLVEAAPEQPFDQDTGGEIEFDFSNGSTRDAESDLPRHEFGTVVHRILEFEWPRSEWPALARRIAAVNGFEITEETVSEVVEHATDAKEFLDAQATTHGASETYEELSISVDIDDLRIVGDIDHLRVTPDAFIITDYKTNRLRTRTTGELAEYYRPQMMSYALALLEHDLDREVLVNLRFTDVSETESFQWNHTNRDSLADELSKLGNLID
jgi:ATP-dependent helicase/nuclease subunit A